MQTAHYNTLRFSVLISSVQGKKQADWDAIAERIHRVGEPGAPLHLKIKAYHVDLASGDVERPGMILKQIAAMASVVPPAPRSRRHPSIDSIRGCEKGGQGTGMTVLSSGCGSTYGKGYCRISSARRGFSYGHLQIILLCSATVYMGSQRQLLALQQIRAGPSPRG
jgi:hypothetical protein